MENNHKIILPYQLPKNLELLHEHEEEIREQSAFEKNKDPKLVDHLEIVHAALDMIYTLNTYYENQSDDELTIQLLGTRLFNSIVSSLKLLLSGYYQVSFMIQRDILETGFLLDFFSIDPSTISDWRNSNNKERLKKYGPAAIRKELDKRDKFKGEKRRQIYQQLCEYSTHPTYAGFGLLAPEGLAKIGPFFSLEFLTSALEGLALYVPNFTVIYIRHFPVNQLSARFDKEFLKGFLEADMNFLDRIKEWSSKYFAVDLSQFNTDEIRELLRQL